MYSQKSRIMKHQLIREKVKRNFINEIQLVFGKANFKKHNLFSEKSTVIREHNSTKYDKIYLHQAQFGI